MAESGSGHVRYAVNGQVRIAYEDLGGTGGAPLLLIMGLAVSRFWWPDALVSEFVRRGFHVVAYDQRDAGQSTHFPDAGTGGPLAAVLRRHSPAYTAEDMTDDAVAVLDALGWDSAHLFGHSMGGQVAQRTGTRHPGRVRSLTSSASLPGDVGGLSASRYIHLGLVARLARMRFTEGRDGDLALAVAATRAIASLAYPFDEQVIRAMAARDEVSGLRDTAAQSRQAGAKWHGGPLSQLRVPTLVLHGSDDPLLRPAAARRTAQAISGARLVILPRVGHYLPAEVYPQVAGEVRALAERAAAAPSPTDAVLAPRAGHTGRVLQPERRGEQQFLAPRRAHELEAGRYAGARRPDGLRGARRSCGVEQPGVLGDLDDHVDQRFRAQVLQPGREHGQRRQGE